MMEKSTCSSAGHPAPASPSPDSEEVSKTREVTLRWSLQGWLFAHTPVGWYGKMSPEYCRAGKDAILPLFSHCFQGGKFPLRSESGKTQVSSRQLPELSAWVGECLTLNIPEFNNFQGLSRSDGDVSSLSDILEAAKVSPEFSLGANFARAILRRAEERGEKLPAEIESACRSILRTSTAG